MGSNLSHLVLALVCYNYATYPLCKKLTDVATTYSVTPVKATGIDYLQRNGLEVDWNRLLTE
ncbi:hypothetical protein DPMN_076513 [Dreissena polymorpha]|uniref:Uncharacterized protein n=1 Tax=Dreissena polymorpha TaxID=45954 RepID=A0A9D4BMG6_DREPO|nr:hypothetical protein DPMN_076513 [Dreissena polymorpha]